MKISFFEILRLAAWGVLCAIGFSLGGVLGFAIVVGVLAAVEIVLALLTSAFSSIARLFGWGAIDDKPRRHVPHHRV